MTRFKFLFGHKTAAWKPNQPTVVREFRTALFKPSHDPNTLLDDFDEGNDDVNAIRSSLGLADYHRPASE